MREVMEEMSEAGFTPNTATWATLRAASSSPEDVRAVIADMRAAGVSPSQGCWTALLKTYVCPSDRARVLEEMAADGVDVTVKTWNNLLRSYSDEGEVKACMEKMNIAGVTPDEESWQVLLLRQKGRGAAKLRGILTEMSAANVAVNVNAWNMLLNECSHDEIRPTLAEMQAAGVAPSVVTWNILLKSPLRLSQPRKVAGLNGDVSHNAVAKEVRDVMDEMTAAGVSHDRVTWNTLLQAYKFEQPQHMRDVMDEMLATGVEPDSVSYSTLFNCYLRNGEASAVVELYNTHLKEKPDMINNYVATAVIRAFAACSDEVELKEFWNAYNGRLLSRDVSILTKISHSLRDSESSSWGILQTLLSENKSTGANDKTQ
jgi:pentatricopeptide repeat protein